MFVSDLQKLRTETSATLKVHAEKIYCEFASTEGMEKIYKKDAEFDEVKYKTVMIIRGFLHFSILQRAIKFGNVGLMRTMLPHLFFRFHGGSSSKYSI